MSIKLPLPLKLMISYLLVVGLVMIPTALYLRRSLVRDQQDDVRRELQAEVVGVVHRLGDGSPPVLAARVPTMVDLSAQRLTVVDARGVVMGDTAGEAALRSNHLDRPEIQAAIAHGMGTALRRSATTGQVMIYVAMRFPTTGELRGVARLARSVESIDAASRKVSDMLRGAGAVALSVAVLLSLVAALAASRPLSRIALAARAFAEGDFGATVSVDSNDEIGEVARALDGLAAQLRSKLVASGADHATLLALVDELPVGVVLYDRALQALRVNEVARRLLALEPHIESARAAEVATLAAQHAAMERVLRAGVSESLPLRLPWRSDAQLRARWIAVFSPTGERTPALVVHDVGADEGEARRAAVIARAVTALRACGAAVGDLALANVALDLADEAEDTVPVAPPEASAVRAVTLSALCDEAERAISPRLLQAGVTFGRSVSEGTARVADADARLSRALVRMLVWAVRATPAGGHVELRVTVSEGSARLFTSTGASAPDISLALLRWLHPIGAETGFEARDDRVERWIATPLA